MVGGYFPVAIKRSWIGGVLRKVGKPLLPGWVDEGRKLVQEPEFARIMDNAGLNRIPPRRVLNAGAGEGLYSHFLLAMLPNARIAEIDLSYSARRRKSDNQKQFIMAASLTSLPFAAECFDFILCSEVLEHIAEDERALDELVRVLAPYGHLLISVPTPPAVFDRAHVREGYKPPDLERMLEKRGLKVIETRFCMHHIFQFFLKLQSNFQNPKIVIWTLSRLDRMLKIGAAMDLIILATLNAPRDPTS